MTKYQASTKTLVHLLLVGVLTGAAACEGAVPDTTTSPRRDAEANVWPVVEEGATQDKPSGPNPWLSLGEDDAPPLTTEQQLAPQINADSPTLPNASPQAEGTAPAKSPDPPPTTASEEQPESPNPLLQLFEYWEGEGSHKVLSVRHLGPAAAEGACVIEIYNNGGTQPWRTITLPVVWPPAHQETLCTPAATEPRCTGSLSTSTFNGDDALVVRCDDEIQDSFGRVGEDPGDAWGDPGGLLSRDRRMVRCGSERDTELDDAFDPASSWFAAEPTAEMETALQHCLDSSGLGGAGGGPAG